MIWMNGSGWKPKQLKNVKIENDDFVYYRELVEIYNNGYISTANLIEYIKYLKRVDKKLWNHTAIENEYNLCTATVSNILRKAKREG